VYTDSVFAYGIGVIARYVNDDNYLWLRVHRSSTRDLELVKKIAGVETVIASVPVSGSIGPTAPAFLTLVVFATGRVVGLVTGAHTATLDTTDSVLATAGALASGKGGIADQSKSNFIGYRKYDDVVVSTPAAEPIVMYASRQLDIRHDSTERQSSDGTQWGRPPSYRGARFKVGPAGDRDRTTRVVVLAHRNNLDAGGVWEPLDDQLTVAATVTPRCSVVPR
jgi:hypothetical protein